MGIRSKIKGAINREIQKQKEKQEERRNLKKIYESRYKESLKRERRKQAHSQAERDAARKARQETERKHSGKGTSTVDRILNHMDKMAGTPNPFGFDFGQSSAPRKHLSKKRSRKGKRKVVRVKKK